MSRPGTGGPGGESAPVYRRLLGEAFDALPQALRSFHGDPGGGTWTGAADVSRGRGAAARFAGWVAGFPPEGRGVPLTVEVRRDRGGETWVRDYAGHRMSSRQGEGFGRWSGLLVERFGPVRVGLALVAGNGGLSLGVRRWSVLGIPLPIVLAPGGDVRETEMDGRFAFHVEVASPLMLRLASRTFSALTPSFSARVE